MIEMLTLHEDAFYEYFRPYRHPSAQHDIWGGHGLETYGSDLALVCRLDPTYLWTVVDGENDQWITTGLHYVNRVCYLVTEIPHNNANVEFRVPYRLSTLTPLGLRRQLTKIQRLLSTQAVQ
ncbi:MAG: hypothetical protein ACXU8A_02425 [Burkholderiaceae bacterium]